MTYGKPAKGNALRIECDHVWVASEGYRPIRFRISPIGKAKFTRDRQITIQLNHFQQWNEFPREMTSRTVDLPEGQSVVTITMYPLQNRVQSRFEVEVWEGRRTSRNVHRTGLNERGGQIVWNEAAPSLLIVDSDLPTLADRANGQDQYRGDIDTNENGVDGKLPAVARFVLAVKPMWPVGLSQKGKSRKDLSWVDISDDVPTCEYLAPEDLPDSWLGLSGIDIFYISLDDLKRVREEFPGRFQSLVDWIRIGGMIWVSGVGDDLANVSELEAVLGMGRETQRVAGVTSVEPVWEQPKTRKFKDRLSELEIQQQYQWVNGQYIVPDNEDFEFPEDIGPPRRYFGIRRFQLGRVVAWQEEDPFRSKEPWFWEWTLKVLGPQSWMWSRRQGFSSIRTNNDFWKFLIPGVGLAPVNLFRIAMTLFVLVIGPLNYSLLRRWKRLNWMLFTVPACALLVTFALANYALLTDGISVKSRVRSLTMVDQRKGHATTWSRQAYYAGIAPSSGLVFPKDAAVYPLEYDPVSRIGRGGRPRRVTWDKNQNLSLGFLTSRTTVQFVVQRTRDSSMGLQFPNGSQNPSAFKNELRGDILELLLADDGGDLFVAHNVAEGTQGELEAFDSDDVPKWMGECVVPHELSVPEGVEVEMIRSFTMNRWQYENANNHLSESEMSQNRANEIVGRLRKPKPRSYLAVLKRCSEVPMGVEFAHELESFYLIIGEF